MPPTRNPQNEVIINQFIAEDAKGRVTQRVTCRYCRYINTYNVTRIRDYLFRYKL